jgi:hypothetical protein
MLASKFRRAWHGTSDHEAALKQASITEDSAPGRRQPWRPGEGNPSLHPEPNRAIGKDKAMSAPSDADVIRRSLAEPEAFGLIYDRHATPCCASWGAPE